MEPRTIHLHVIMGPVLFSILAGCSHSPKMSSDADSGPGQAMVSGASKPAADPITRMMATPWKAANTDTSQWYLRVDFHDEYLTYWYHGQCVFWYFTQSKGDTIQLLWTYKADCLLDMAFLERHQGAAATPLSGDVFADYWIENDSTVRVRYNFPEWITAINVMNRDSIFPQFLHRYEPLNP